MRLRKTSRRKEIATDPAEVFKKIDNVDWANAPDKAALNNELKRELEQSIGTLLDDLRSAVVMRDVQGLTNDEAAEVLDISVSALKARLHRGRVMLRGMLAEYVKQRGV